MTIWIGTRPRCCSTRSGGRSKSMATTCWQAGRGRRQGVGCRAARSRQDEYVARRVNDQIDWYKPKADGYRKSRQFAAADRVLRSRAPATLITAVASVAGKASAVWLPFDFAALTAVLTTDRGRGAAHVEASRFDFLAMTYLATARRLEDRRDGRSPAFRLRQRLREHPGGRERLLDRKVDQIAGLAPKATGWPAARWRAACRARVP